MLYVSHIPRCDPPNWLVRVRFRRGAWDVALQDYGYIYEVEDNLHELCGRKLQPKGLA